MPNRCLMFCGQHNKCIHYNETANERVLDSVLQASENPELIYEQIRPKGGSTGLDTPGYSAGSLREC